MPKILIVEDNPENWDMLSRRLMRRGFDPVHAADGLIAVEMAVSESPDLILMDMNLPGIDGWEATRRIRANAALPRIPIIAVTAHGMPGDRDRIIEVGCDDHHCKPVELAELLGQIEAILGKGRSDSGEQAPGPAR